MLRRLYRFVSRLIIVSLKVVFVATAFVVALLFLANAVVSTPRLAAYRNLHPYLDVCQQGLKDGWSVLVDRDPALEKQEDNNGWVDPSNSETRAVAQDAAWQTRFRCALQKHVVPSQRDRAHDLAYYLGFLEFDESGEPFALAKPGADGEDVPATPDVTTPTGKVRMLTQLDALRTHLGQGSNYVIVFVHGWRHNAAVGDGNVADLRLYAAHVARFLARRCELDEKTFCDMRVTAIFVGWRGARVDEAYLRRKLGDTVGGVLGTVAAAATLFDRKPVSERVAPGAVSALRAIERTLTKYQPNGELKPHPQENRMIVFGHSLGANMLATGLHDDLLKLVRAHKGAEKGKTGEPIPPVLGDLTVLINPASEAWKWTSVQREVWGRIPFHTDATKTLADLVAGHTYFPKDQRPVIVSVTSALRFPPDGLRTADCSWLAMNPVRKADVDEKTRHGDKPIDYDWATEDLFPTFKFDFRPLSQRMLRLAASIETRPPPGQSCLNRQPTRWQRIKSWPVRKLAATLADFPFQNFNEEDSHTIGHLDPPRPADGLLTDFSYSSGAPFGTTHELFGLETDDAKKHNPYATLADAWLPCEPANHWLSRAREAAPPHGVFWDTDRLAPSTGPGENPPAARFLHGSRLSGTAAITRANDPFWNMRAYDNALARHDGYKLSSFICAMNQLVMDDITRDKPEIPSLAIDPTPVAPAPAKP